MAPHAVPLQCQSSSMNISLKDLSSKYPAPWDIDPLPEIRTHLRKSKQVIVVLDDDPTGTQTVYDLPVLTEWDVNTLQAEIERETPVFYILTNSRSLPEAEAEELAKTIGKNLLKASQKTDTFVSVISRSDSTLRGHYPAEVVALQEALEQSNAIHLIIPFFEEGGRLTLEDVHYVAEGDTLIPSAETPFAKDASFGYTQSNLKAWVEEKTQGSISAEDVTSISLETLRNEGPEEVANVLRNIPDRSVCIVNALTMRDMEVFVYGQIIAGESGKTFIARTGASYVRARAGLSKKPLLTREDFGQTSTKGGMIIVGSYVPKTSAQLEAFFAKAEKGIEFIELDVNHLIDADQRQKTLTNLIQKVDALLEAGTHVLIYTSRKLVTGSSQTENLAIGNTVSNALVEIVKRIGIHPRFIIAKGGITSSDVATQGLGVKRAMVEGQLLPGVPVWKLGNESRYPGMHYVVFPGNVGSDTALHEAYTKLK